MLQRYEIIKDSGDNMIHPVQTTHFAYAARIAAAAAAERPVVPRGCAK